MSLQMQSQHQIVIQNYCPCKCRANISESYKIIVIANAVYAEPTSNGHTKIIVIANAERTSNGHTKSLALQMQSQRENKNNWTAENILKIQDKNCIKNSYIMIG